MEMKKIIFTLTVTLLSALILSSCAFHKENNIDPSENDMMSSISESEIEQKTENDVIADTNKEFARYQELYPDEMDIADIVTPVIQKSESDNKGYTNYVVDFFDAYNATLTIELPEQFSVRLYNESERLYASLKDMGVAPFYSSAVCISDKENNVIGGISSATIMYPDDLIPGVDQGPLVYQGLFTGMANTWDFKYNPIYLTDTECTATTYMSYPDYALKETYPRDFARVGNLSSLGGGSSYYYNKGILSYNTQQLKYVAIEMDFDCISDEELLSVAKSVKIS